MESSGLDEQHKALFRLVDKVNHESASMTAADLDTARAAGWTDEALYFAITVCALFNFYNRWIDATGVHALSDEAHRQGGQTKRTARLRQELAAFAIAAVLSLQGVPWTP